MGWFYGFKLHLVINDCGELLSVKLTPGNTDDRHPVKEWVKGLTGHLYGDKGYLSQALSDELEAEGRTLITSVRRNMKAKFLSLWDKIMLRKRFLIETVNDKLKNISQIEHSRHRSIVGFLLEVVSGLIAYTFQPKKPSLNLRDSEIAILRLINNFPLGMPSQRYDPKKCRWMSSSGSSGKQVQIILPQKRANLDILFKYRMFEFMSGKKIDPARWIYNIHYCMWWHSSVLGEYRVFTLSQDCPEFYALNHIKAMRPQIISSIGSYLGKLAALGERLDIYGVELISTNSETTTQEERYRYEAIFKVPVRDEYSSEELDIMAMQCVDKHYHLVEDDVHLEVINRDAQGVGDIIGTDLWNDAMPMIRYQQGDLCELDDSREVCSCGSHFRKIRKLHGRADQGLTTLYGNTISPGSILDAVERFFCRDETNIAEFRVVQLAPDRINVLYVIKNDAVQHDVGVFDAFQHHLSNLFSHKVYVHPIRMKQIPREKSYKRRTVINKCKT